MCPRDRYPEGGVSRPLKILSFMSLIPVVSVLTVRHVSQECTQDIASSSADTFNDCCVPHSGEAEIPSGESLEVNATRLVKHDQSPVPTGYPPLHVACNSLFRSLPVPDQC